MSAANPFGPQSPGGTTTPASTFTNGAAHDPAIDETTQAAIAEPEALPTIDLDDPLFTAETLTAREGDAFAEPPPPPDRRYRVQLKLRGVTALDYKGADFQKYSGGGDVAPWVAEPQIDKQTKQAVGITIKTIIDVRIHDPKYPEFEGIFLQFPFKWCDSRPGRNNGPSRMMTILNLLRQPSGEPWLIIGQNYGPRAMAEIFVKAMAGEPELICLSEWTWNCQLCGEAAKKAGGRYPNPIEGMNKFNMIPGKAGVYNHELRCAAVPAHGFSKARAQASQFFALDGK